MSAQRARKTDETTAAPSAADRPLAASTTRTSEPSGRRPATLDAGDLFPPAAGDVPAVQAKLEVGAVDDPYERDADRMADQVMRQIEPDGASAPLPSGRVARSSADVEIGADGGAVPGSLQRSIESSSGSSMSEGLRSSMEQGFGRDLSGVRVHTDSDAAGRIAARAFTHGNDIHFAPGQFQPDTAGGRRLIAHELAHVVQQTDGRTVSRLMWDSKRFLSETSQRMTRKSTAQKTLAPMLDEYHTKYPFGDLDEATAKAALEHVIKMRMIADAYVAKNSKTVEDSLTGDTETIKRSSREHRLDGMIAFVEACKSEASWLQRRADRGKAEADKVDLSAVEVSASSDGTVAKLKDHYAGDAASCFRKLGALVDMAVPAPGDAASISLEVEIPIEPGLAITLGLGAEASRGMREAPDPGKTETPPQVDVGMNIEAGVAADAKVVKVGAALGGYVASSAKTGADAAELISYALFRRARSSKAVPREVTNFMWGEGNSDAFGWQVAEAWSLGVEERLLDSQMVGGEEQNENFVETGGYGKASAEVGFDKLAKLGIEAKAYSGTRIDATSLKARKGGAGKANLKSGAQPGSTADRMSKQGTRGTAQKNVGRSTHGFKLSAEAGNDFIGGGLEFGMRWISDGAHGKKTYELAGAELGGAVSFTMPGDQLVAGGLGNYVPALIKTINTLVARGRDRAAAQEGKKARDLGALGTGIGSIASSIAELGSDPESWKPKLEMDDSSSLFSSSTTYQLAISGDFTDGSISISLTQEKGSEVGKAAEEITKTASGAAGAKLKMSRTSTLLVVKWDGSKWKYSWAGGEG